MSLRPVQTICLLTFSASLLAQPPAATLLGRLPPKWTDGLRFQRLMDVNAAYDEAANAFWLQAR
jgi:hypothetical protein